MLPFLKPRKVAGLIMAVRKPDGSKMETGMEGDEDQGLMSCGEDLIKAVHAKDASAVVAAIKAAFEILDSEPHVEGPHEEPSEG